MTPRIVVPMLCLCLASAALAEEPPALETRVFDVSALLSGRLDADLEVLGLDGSVQWWSDEEEDEAVCFLDSDQLTTLIETFVDPQVWLRDGVSFDWIDERRLTMTAPPRTLDETATLLADLFRYATRRIEIRAELVTLDATAVKRLEAATRVALMAGRMDAKTRAAFLAIADGEGGARLDGAVSLRPGRVGRIAMTASTSYVADLDVEIATCSAVGDPIVRFLTEGWLLHVRPVLLTSGEIWLEAIHQTAARTGPIRRVDPEAKPLGMIDLPAVNVERLAFVGRVPSGETMALVRRVAGKPGLVALLLTPRMTGGPGDAPVVRHVPTSVLTRPPMSTQIGWHVDERGEWQDFPLDGRTGFQTAPLVSVYPVPAPVQDLSALASEPAGLVVTGAQGFFLENAAALGRVRGRVAAWERRLTRGYRVRMAIDATEGDRTVTVADLRFDAAAGRNAYWLIGTERAFLADWDVEVAQEARVGDPNIGRAFGGVLVRLRLDPGPDGKQISGRLSLCLVDLDETFEVRNAGNEMTGIIEIPRARQLLMDREVVVTPGKSRALAGGRGGDGKSLTLTLEVETR